MKVGMPTLKMRIFRTYVMTRGRYFKTLLAKFRIISNRICQLKGSHTKSIAKPNTTTLPISI